MNSLVKSVINEDAAGGAEITSDAERFVIEILSLVNATFAAINHEVKSVAGKSSGWRERAVERGLWFIADKKNEDTIIDSVVDSDSATQALTQLYFSAMQTLVKDSLDNKKELMRVNFQPFGVFVATLYRELASDPAMKHDYFHTMSGVERDIFMRTALRKVMESSLSMNKSKAASGGGSVFSRPVTPHDSVSNIATATATATAPPPLSVVGSKVGEAVGRSAVSQVIDRGEEGLSEHALSRHNHKRAVGSQFSAFKNASVVKPALSTRVVYVTDSKESGTSARQSSRHHDNSVAGRSSRSTLSSYAE